MKKILSTILFVIVATCVFAQSDIDCRLTKSFINQNMKEWNVFIDELSFEFEKTKSADVQFKRAVVRHLYIAYLLFNDKSSKQIDIQLDALGKDIEELEKNGAYFKKVLALKSPYYAYSALNNPLTAVYRLPMSFSAAKTAIDEAKDSPYSWAEYGNLQYCYALFIGGDFDDAVSSFQKAITLMEKNEKNLSCNWYYLNTLLFLAKSYEDGKKFDKANQVYDKIIKIRPDYEAIHRWKH